MDIKKAGKWYKSCSNTPEAATAQSTVQATIREVYRIFRYLEGGNTFYPVSGEGRLDRTSIGPMNWNLELVNCVYKKGSRLTHCM